MKKALKDKKAAALFFDIDGTLIHGVYNEMPESTVRALKEAKENGHYIFVNTGRTICSIPPAICKGNFHGYLCGCGTYILYDDHVLLSSVIEEEKGYLYIDKMREHQIEGLLEGTEDLYFSSRISRFEGIESVRRYMESRGLGRERSMEQKGFRYDKLLICTDEYSDKEGFFRVIEDELVPIDRTGGVYECIQKNYSKATAIEYMRNYLGLQKDQIYVFGDSSNDLAMFEYADHAVAMKDHDPVLDTYTEYVTDSVENDGIYKAMKYYKLI